MGNFDKRDWKSPTFDGLCPSALDWARMAAYVDGEGSVLINPRRGKHRARYSSEASTFYLKLTVANTDVRLPVWLKSTFGGTYKDANTASYYVGRNMKVAWHWSCSSNRAAWILYNCMPLFILKREQAELGMQLQESLNRGHHGLTLSSEVVEERSAIKKQLLFLKRRGKVIKDGTEASTAVAS